MKKPFRLPKEFAEKWLTALRSGNYKQGDGKLYCISSNSYCCLGIAGRIAGIFNEKLCDQGFLYPDEMPADDIPEELIDENNFTMVLSALNDGFVLNEDFIINIGNESLSEFYSKRKERKTKETEPSYHKPLSFKEIADFIEEFCEFY